MTLTRFRVLVMQSKKENPTATFEDLLDTLMRKPLNSGYTKETKGNRRGKREKKKKRKCGENLEQPVDGAADSLLSNFVQK